MASTLGFALNSANATIGSYTTDVRWIVAGTDRTGAIMLGGITLQWSLGEPTTLTAVAHLTGWTPTKGQEVILALDGVNGTVRLFGGTIVRVHTPIVASTLTPYHEITAVDYTWLLDRYARVAKTYYSRGINSIARDVIASYTDGGFVLGYAPSTLGVLDGFDGQQQSPMAVLRRLAAAATGGATLSVDAYKRVHLFASPSHLSADTITIADGGANVLDFTHDDELTDIATRVYVVGQATTLRESVAYGATSLPIASWAPFQVESGKALVGGTDLIAYTSGTTVPGSESLSSVTGLTRDWAAGTPVAVVAEVDDAEAQTALATALGGGLSGVAVRWIEDDALVYAEAAALGQGELARLKSGVATVSGRMFDGLHAGAASVQPGASVTVNVTTPIAVSGTFKVQAVTLTREVIHGAARWVRTFTAGPVLRGYEVLERLRGAA